MILDESFTQMEYGYDPVESLIFLKIGNDVEPPMLRLYKDCGFISYMPKIIPPNFTKTK